MKDLHRIVARHRTHEQLQKVLKDPHKHPLVKVAAGVMLGTMFVAETAELFSKRRRLF